MNSQNPAASPATSRHRMPGLPSSESDPVMADPPRSELLAHLPRRKAPSRRPTAVPDRPSGGRGDATVTPGGRASPSSRWRSPGPLGVPLDRHREWYHHHHLSATCSARNWAHASPSWSSSSTLGRRPGAKPTACPSWPSTMPRPRMTPTRSPGWSKASRSPPTPADAPRPPAGGSSGSRIRG